MHGTEVVDFPNQGQHPTFTVKKKTQNKHIKKFSSKLTAFNSSTLNSKIQINHIHHSLYCSYTVVVFPITKALLREDKSFHRKACGKSLEKAKSRQIISLYHSDSFKRLLYWNLLLLLFLGNDRHVTFAYRHHAPAIFCKFI